jgi:hypothetical protein
MSEDEGDVIVAAGVGQPVPAVHAFAGDDKSVAEGQDGFAEGLGSGREIARVAYLSGMVEDDEEESSGVEIDAGIESGFGCRLEVAHEDLSSVLSYVTLLDAAGSDAGRLRDLFRNPDGKRAWGRVIVSAGKGLFRLADPPR